LTVGLLPSTFNRTAAGDLETDLRENDLIPKLKDVI